MKKKTKKKVTPRPKYTHIDSSGMAWRMQGMRPVSALADKIMREAGL